MKTINYILIAAIAVLVVICSSQFKSSDIPEADKEAIITEVRKEKIVKEAIITDANVLYVSVSDDGTSRNGYASYLCQLLKEKQSKIRQVKIVRVGSTNDSNRDNAYGVLLGESNCSN